MKPHLLLLLCLLLAAAFQAAAQPKLVIPEGMNLDFGTIYTGKSFVKDLTIRNAGTIPLELTSVSASCGCTGTFMHHNVVNPNDSTTLTITFDPSRFAGEVEKSITMNTNDTANPHIRILFKANVVKALAVAPEYVVFRTTLDSTALDTLLLQNLSSTPVRILSATASGPEVALKPASTSLPPGETAEVLLHFTPKGAGTAKGTITITTDHPNMSVINLRYFALVTPKSSQ